MTPEDVEALFQAQNEVAASDAESASQARTQLLRGLLETLEKRRSSEPGRQGLDLYAERLATGSRDGSWRIPLGDSGLLGFFLGVVGEEGISQALKIHSLRLIGNSCADTKENRERAVEAGTISTIIGFLTEPDLLPYAVAVLYNILLDHAPAQLQASNLKLSSRLVDVVSGPDLDAFQGQLNLICMILTLLVSQEPEPTNANPDTPLILLKLSQDPRLSKDLDDVFSLVSVSLEYLSHAAVQTPFITSGGIPLFLTIFETLHAPAYDAETLAEDPALANQSTVLRKVLVNALADLSDNPAFAAAHPAGGGGGPVFARLRGWLGSPDPPGLQAGACLSLGNLSRSDEASLAFVGEHAMHAPLAAALSSGSADTLLLHSALSFLKNLAIPPPNKAVLGPLLLAPAALPRIWALETVPQVHLAAASLARLLVVGTPSNVDLLLARPDPTSPQTHLHGLVSLSARTDDPAKTEAARAVLATLRTLASEPSPRPGPGPTAGEEEEEGSQALSDPESFYRGHQEMAAPISHLLTQTRFPPLRSETFFVLGLLASRAPSSVPAILALLSSPAVLDVFRAAISGSLPAPDEPSADVNNPLAVSEPRDPKGGEGAARADRENCLVVVSRLVGFLGEGPEDEGRKGELEGLLRDAGVVLGKEG